MGKKAASPKKARGIPSRLRSRKALAIIAGTTALVILAVVLILTNVGAPDENGVPGNVLALVDGEPITRADVSNMQRIVLHWDGVWEEAEQVLDQLITQRLLFREAESRGYVPSDEYVETELISRLVVLGIPIRELYSMLEETGISYEEFMESRKLQLAITALLDDEIEPPEVTEEEAIAYYEDYRERFMEMVPGREPPPFEEIRSEIVRMAGEEKRQEAISAYVKELRDNADIVYMNSA